VELQCNSVLSSADPQVDVSATLLLDFLEVTGNALYCHYGQQFQKLLQLICKEYIPKIEQVILRSK
jgi:nucleoporin GLE1